MKKKKIYASNIIIYIVIIIGFIIITPLLIILYSNNKGDNNNKSKGSNKSTNNIIVQNLSQDEIDYKLTETSNFIVNIWNESICETKWYIEDGTNSIGGQYSYDKVVRNTNRILAKMPEYDNFIKSLDDTKYDALKEIWNKITPEINTLTTKILNEEPTALDKNYEFDYENFQTLMYDFMDEISMIETYESN